MSIIVEALSFSYESERILSDVNLTAERGELVSILGPNGVGKSTLFRCILGLLKGYDGSIRIDGADSRNMKAAELSKRIAYIPQSNYPAFNYSVLNMVMMGATSRLSAFSSPGKAEREAAYEALSRLGVGGLAEKGYVNLSGGERQLVLMARALIQNAKILILDEPTANLDYGNQLKVMERIRELTDSGYTVIQSTHNPEQAFMFSHKVAAMKDGRMIAIGAPKEIMTERLMEELYHADIRVCSLYDDKVRVCVPKRILKGE